MLRNTTRIGFVFAVFLGLCTVTAYGQSALIFKASYDLEINLADESRSVKSRAQVRDGSTIPIEIGQYRVEIGISSTSPGYYKVDFLVSENANGIWIDTNLARVSFSGEDGVPVWFKWGTAEIHVNLELVASGARQ